MISYRNKRILLQILPFGIIPAIFSLILALLEKGILGDHPVYPSTGNPYEFRFVIPVITSLIIGFMIGAFEAFYVNKWFQKRTFLEKLIFKSTVYMLAIILATLIIISIGHASALEVSPISEQVRNYVAAFFSNFAFWSIMSYYSIAIIGSLFYMEVSNNMGQSVSLNFFTGKYHQPKVEERVYMFIDMKSSTTFAEQLGHIRYFQLLQEYYVDLSDSIIQYGGEIYQYVGDEVVITWKVKANFAAKALDCFFNMKETLNRQAEKYLSEYGVQPTFKAGVHYGEVTTGEIGVIKKDIAFSGDVLNTTARIQSLCNTYEVDLLASEKFINALKDHHTYKPIELGEVELRGKNEKINLFTVERK